MISLKTLHHSPQLAELKVSYKRRKAANGKQLREPCLVKDSQTAVEYLRSIWDASKLELIEDFYIVCLNSAHEALGWVRVSSGGFDRTTVDGRLIFGIALQAASSAVIVAHNHPSGNVEPSSADRAVTDRLKVAGEMLNIPVLDHIILGRESAFSFADAGYL